MKFLHVAAACVMSGALLAGVAPAGAVLTTNVLTTNALVANALAPIGSSLGDRNRIDGVEPDPRDKTGEIVFDQLSQIDPGNRE